MYNWKNVNADVTPPEQWRLEITPQTHGTIVVPRNGSSGGVEPPKHLTLNVVVGVQIRDDLAYCKEDFLTIAMPFLEMEVRKLKEIKKTMP